MSLPAEPVRESPAPGPSRLARARWWLGVGAWAVVDQALIGLANFILNILLARWLDPVAYGAFAAGYALIWAVFGIYIGLLIDPAMVFTAHRFRDDVPSYHSSLVTGHAALSIGFVVAFACAGAVARAATPGSGELPWFTLGIAGPIMFLPVVLRSLCRARLQTAVGAGGALIYALGAVLGTLVCYRLRMLSTTAALAIMAAASAGSAVWLAPRLHLNFDGLLLRRRDLVRRIAAEHWRYGRWLVGVSLLSWVPGNIWYAALPLLTKISDAGTLRALANLAQPAMQAYVATHSVLIPMFVLARTNRRFVRTLNLMLMASLAGSIVFAVSVGIFAKPLVGWLYGGRYVAQPTLVWPIMLSLVIWGLAIVQSAAMQALERADWLMASYATAAVVSIAVGVPAMAVWGLGGAVAGQCLAVSALVVAQRCWLRRQLTTIDEPPAIT